MAGKPIRLGKAAGELNVGVTTIVEFLNKKGVQVDTNMNAKLEAEHYDMLKQEFAADQDLKEKSKLSLGKREKRETVSLRDSRPEDQKDAAKPVVEAPVATEKVSPVVETVAVLEQASEPTPAKVEEVKPEPVKVEEVKAVEPVVEVVEPVKEVVAPVKEEKAVEPVVEVVAPQEGEKKVQVIGKIDLDKINSKTRPDKKPKSDDDHKSKGA